MVEAEEEEEQGLPPQRYHLAHPRYWQGKGGGPLPPAHHWAEHHAALKSHSLPFTRSHLPPGLTYHLVT